MGEDNCKWYVYKAVHIQNKLKRSYNSKLKKKNLTSKPIEKICRGSE